MFFRRLTRFIAVGATAIAVGSAYGTIRAAASNGWGSVEATASPATSGQDGPGSGRSNARSEPATGGTAGTVDSVSSLSPLSFVILTSTGQKVNVETASSTTYRKAASPAAASDLTKGESVLVLGTVNGTTITASQVMVQAAGAGGSATSPATAVVPFQRGAPSTPKQAGQIPPNYRQGSGTLVGGTEANKATEAALTAYPGGIVNRVVGLSDGEYEVHNIGVSWPHHIFVSRDFKVVGAD
jgi:hypothetical protein